MKTQKTTSATTVPHLTKATAAARELGIPYTSLRDIAFRGEIPVVKIGRSWYFDRRDLVKFVESSKEVLA